MHSKPRKPKNEKALRLSHESRQVGAEMRERLAFLLTMGYRYRRCSVMERQALTLVAGRALVTGERLACARESRRLGQVAGEMGGEGLGAGMVHCCKRAAPASDTTVVTSGTDSGHK